jgi:hypothetical protein
VRPAVAGLFPGDAYIADCAVVLARDSEMVVGAQAVLIEIDRFNFQTGGALFDWGSDSEIPTGARPFEFRAREEEPYGVDWEAALGRTSRSW